MIHMANMNIKTKLNDNVYLLWNVQDFLNGPPRQLYDTVVREMHYMFAVTCCVRCDLREKYNWKGEKIGRTPLLRQSNACCVCCGSSVASGSHSLCYKCAVRGTFEYEYYHGDGLCCQRGIV